MCKQENDNIQADALLSITRGLRGTMMRAWGVSYYALAADGYMGRPIHRYQFEGQERQRDIILAMLINELQLHNPDEEVLVVNGYGDMDGREPLSDKVKLVMIKTPVKLVHPPTYEAVVEIVKRKKVALFGIAWEGEGFDGTFGIRPDGNFVNFVDGDGWGQGLQCGD